MVRRRLVHASELEVMNWEKAIVHLEVHIAVIREVDRWKYGP